RFAFAAYATVPVYEAFFRALGWGDRIDPLVSAWREGDRQLALERAPDELIREIFVFGSPAQQRERLEEFAAAGITTFSISPMCGRVDAVMAGTGTLRAERYGRLVRDPERRAARERAGLRPDPLAVVVSRSLHLPLDIPLFQDPGSTIAIYTASDAELEDCPADVRLTRLDPAEMTMTAALRRMHADHGVRSLLCEGGPTVFGALVHERVADELFLTISPK